MSLREPRTKGPLSGCLGKSLGVRDSKWFDQGNIQNMGNMLRRDKGEALRQIKLDLVEIIPPRLPDVAADPSVRALMLCPALELSNRRKVRLGSHKREVVTEPVDLLQNLSLVRCGGRDRS